MIKMVTRKTRKFGERTLRESLREEGSGVERQNKKGERFALPLFMKTGW